MHTHTHGMTRASPVSRSSLRSQTPFRSSLNLVGRRRPPFRPRLEPSMHTRVSAPLNCGAVLAALSSPCTRMLEAIRIRRSVVAVCSHVHKQVHIYKYIYVCIYICMCIFISTCIDVYIYTYACVCTSINIFVLIVRFMHHHTSGVQAHTYKTHNCMCSYNRK